MKKIFVMVAIVLMLVPTLSIAEINEKHNIGNAIMSVEKGEKTYWFNTSCMEFKIEIVPLGNHVYYYSYTQDLHTPNLIRVAWTKGAGRFWFSNQYGYWLCTGIDAYPSSGVYPAWTWKYSKVSLTHESGCYINYGELMTKGTFKNKLNGNTGSSWVNIWVHYDGIVYFDGEESLIY